MNAYQTERLVLTPISLDHEADLFNLHNDPLVQQAIFRNVPQTAQDVRRMLNMFLAQWDKSGFGVWMLYKKAGDGLTFVGRSGLCEYQDTGNLEQASALLKHAVGQGLGAEASRFAVTHAFENSKGRK
ncbi:GNAT family N-acetyltransferase [Bradyrhizobium nanningense]|uniref:GNAT family N-acetyltransferase n=1 Tax=Bradyrhizobium nanningense TaxID=1325118 RepID=UPI0013E8DE05|nr:GNAT family N-acetyltransferase [Bradyrhizobium nanningense]